LTKEEIIDNITLAILKFKENKMKQGRPRKPNKHELSNNDKKRLWEDNVGLIINIAKKYIYLCRILKLQDLVQEGWFGLQRAAELFDENRGTKFSTYAGDWIEQSILRAIKEKDKTVRLPDHIIAGMRGYSPAKEELKKQLNHEPEIEEIAQKMNITISRAKEIKKLIEKPTKFLPMDSLEFEDGTHRDALIAEEKENLWSQLLIDEKELYLFLKKHLDSKEINLLIWRFGLDGNDPLSYGEVGEKINRSRTTAEKRVKEVLRKLKKALKD